MNSEVPRHRRTLEDVVQYMKTQGILHCEVDGLVLTLDPSAFVRPVESDAPIKQEGQPPPTDEEALFAAVGGAPSEADALGLIPQTFRVPVQPE